MKKRKTGKCKYHQSDDWFKPNKANITIISDDTYTDAFGFKVHHEYPAEIPKSMKLKQGDRVSFTVKSASGVLGYTSAIAVKKI